MKLVDVPAGLELSHLPATTWDPDRRILRARADRAPAIRAELVRRGVRFTDSERRLADLSGTILAPLVAARDARPDAAFAALCEADPEQLAGAVVKLLESELASPTDDPVAHLAAELAGELRLEPTIPSLVRCVERLADDPLADVAREALWKFSRLPVGALVDAYGRSADPAARSRIAETLALATCRDGRILELLLRHLERDPRDAAELLGCYGDSDAIPALSRAYDSIDLEHALWPDDAIAVATTIEELGGQLTPEQDARLDAFFEREEREPRPPLPAEPVRRAPRPGRNAPCHCGSGRKYKKCHLPEEEAALRALFVPTHA